MKHKLFCPHCGRCLGECSSSDETGDCRVLINQPHRTKRCFIHNMKCLKCKNEVFIVMEFKEKIRNI